MLRNQKGITLVALVITIIVLLILAGVTISMVLGQNGILNQANQAKAENQKATVEEQIQMAVFAETSQYLQDNVLADSEAGSSALAECIKNAITDTEKDSQLWTSLPEGYEVSNPTDATTEDGKSVVEFTVKANGATYTAQFDPEAQETIIK